ncbi:MAG: FAD-dependent oxidoreductase [Spirochaetota bacterium]
MQRHETDVLVAGGGTAGVVAAVAAARCGARTALVEAKGYPGGIAVEGGTALHSFYNLWKAFPGVDKRQVVRGLPAELVDRLDALGGTSGHAEAQVGWDYDSVCTAIDTELYKLVALEMLEEAGVDLWLNTFVTGASREGDAVVAVDTAGRTPAERVVARQFIDTTGYGDLAAYAGASFTEPNDYPVANSMGVGGVDVEAYHRWLAEHDALSQYVEGTRDGEPGRIVRLDAIRDRLPDELVEAAREIGMAFVVTTVHDDYFMFVKLNARTPESPTRREVVAAAELELRRRQHKAIELIRRWIPGAQKAFIARTSPSICIRRGRCIECDYDITATDVTSARHFDDDVAAYGFHDFAPRIQIADGGTYGIPYRALRPAGIDNLLVAGMLITSDHEAHMSTRNTVACMAQGQAAGTAAALCADRRCTTRELPYADLRERLVADGVYFE